MIPWAPLARGLLTRLPAKETNSKRNDMKKYEGAASFAVDSSEVDKKTIPRLKEIADNKGWTMAEVELAWLVDKSLTLRVRLQKIKKN